ncbi:DUF6086 family protein [Streptomyces sp. NPDC017993]|uniref:DUF6086 family protein n=1 Tax=Streptomyces sp. NPDC017993 TaxID=3365027 RepID=UPI0037ABE63A
MPDRPTSFKAFADALPARHRGASHAVLAALTEGFVVTVPVLAERARGEANWWLVGAMRDGRTDVQVPAPASISTVGDEAWATALRQKACEPARIMAR